MNLLKSFKKNYLSAKLSSIPKHPIILGLNHQLNCGPFNITFCFRFVSIVLSSLPLLFHMTDAWVFAGEREENIYYTNKHFKFGGAKSLGIHKKPVQLYCLLSEHTSLVHNVI